MAKKNFLFNKLEDIENKVNKLYDEHREPQWYNPWELIKYKCKGLEIIWRYKGVYHRNMKELYELVSLNVVNPELLVKYPTFSKYLNDELKAAWMCTLGIQPVFIVPASPTNYSITTDGVFVSNDKLSRRNTRPYDSYTNFVVDGERINVNVALMVWQAFIDENSTEEEKGFYFIDGDMSNTALNNLDKRVV